jgi:HPr kinase/phosphorylase
MKTYIELKKLIDSLKFTPLFETRRTHIAIETSDLNRPGIQLCGYFEYFAHNRVQLLGMTEITYLQTLSSEMRKEISRKYFSYSIPCVMVARNLFPPEEFISEAKKHDIPVLISGLTTSNLGHSVILFFDDALAPCITRHGGLMDLFGIGMYITGDSGVGKSETALELIKRGHRFIADDVVEIRKLSDSRLVGRSPETVLHLMELRGIGLIDVSVLYGMGTVVREKDIDICIHLEPGDITNIDRLGLEDDYVTILGINIPTITIPVRPGRNIAIIMEVAAMNHRLKEMGYAPSDKLDQRLLGLLNGEN